MHDDVPFPANAFLVTSIARERNESDWSDLQIVITPRIPLEDETPIWVGLPIILNRIDSVGELRFNAAAYQQPTWDDSDLAIVDYKMYSSAPIDMEKHLEGLKLGMNGGRDWIVFSLSRYDLFLHISRLPTARRHRAIQKLEFHVAQSTISCM